MSDVAQRRGAHVVIDPITDPDGNLIGFAKITRDLTERREAQEKLEQAKEALVQSQRLEAIGKFTGGVAHDFNNLLAVVLGSVELAQKRVNRDDIQLQRLHDNIRHAAQRRRQPDATNAGLREPPATQARAGRYRRVDRGYGGPPQPLARSRHDIGGSLPKGVSDGACRIGSAGDGDPESRGQMREMPCRPEARLSLK